MTVCELAWGMSRAILRPLEGPADPVKTKLLIFILAAFFMVLLIGGSCARKLMTQESVGIWTPAPVSGPLMTATRPANILPTSALPVATQPMRPTSTPAVQPTAVPSDTQEPNAMPSPTPNSNPQLVVITESDIQKAIASGVANQGGASAENLKVDFADGKLIISATKIAYGAIKVNNLSLVGRLMANAGQLRLETESISPRGLVTAMIPTLANQALAQYASQWYIEEVRIVEGRLELKVR